MTEMAAHGSAEPVLRAFHSHTGESGASLRTGLLET
uniref:Uncharacterized protein n=1 Tax=Anguilla anguilla TaxID=7936 RepID=A0A0E9Q281_ANGAN